MTKFTKLTESSFSLQPFSIILLFT